MVYFGDGLFWRSIYFGGVHDPVITEGDILPMFCAMRAAGPAPAGATDNEKFGGTWVAKAAKSLLRRNTENASDSIGFCAVNMVPGTAKLMVRAETPCPGDPSGGNGDRPNMGDGDGDVGGVGPGVGGGLITGDQLPSGGGGNGTPTMTRISPSQLTIT